MLLMIWTGKYWVIIAKTDNSSENNSENNKNSEIIAMRPHGLVD